MIGRKNVTRDIKIVITSRDNTFSTCPYSRIPISSSPVLYVHPLFSIYPSPFCSHRDNPVESGCRRQKFAQRLGLRETSIKRTSTVTSLDKPEINRPQRGAWGVTPTSRWLPRHRRSLINELISVGWLLGGNRWRRCHIWQGTFSTDALTLTEWPDAEPIHVNGEHVFPCKHCDNVCAYDTDIQYNWLLIRNTYIVNNACIPYKFPTTHSLKLLHHYTQ